MAATILSMPDSEGKWWVCPADQHGAPIVGDGWNMVDVINDYEDWDWDKEEPTPRRKNKAPLEALLP